MFEWNRRLVGVGGAGVGFLAEREGGGNGESEKNEKNIIFLVSKYSRQGRFYWTLKKERAWLWFGGQYMVCCGSRGQVYGGFDYRTLLEGWLKKKAERVDIFVSWERFFVVLKGLIMSKRELIDCIRQINRSAKPEFLANFAEKDLSCYLEHLMDLDLEKVLAHG